MATSSESTLITVRTHWGIFIPAVVIAIFLTLGTLPILFFLKMTSNLVSQLGPPMPHPTAALWLVFVPDLIICAIVFSAALYAYTNSTVTLTNRRLVFNNLFASRLCGELPLENIESIFIYSPLLGGLFGYGTVTVTTIGGKVFPMRFLASPQLFHASLQRAIVNAKAPQKGNMEAIKPLPKDDSRYMPQMQTEIKSTN